MTVREDIGIADGAPVDAMRLQQQIMRTPWLAEYHFAIRSAADIDAFLDAEFQAMQSGVDILSALWTYDRIAPERYTEALASLLGVPAAAYDVVLDISKLRAKTGPAIFLELPVAGTFCGSSVLVMCATRLAPRVVAMRVAEAHASGNAVVLVAERQMRSAVELSRANANLKIATFGLKRRLPMLSASRAAPLWQPLSAIVFFALVAAALSFNLIDTLAILTMLLTVPFVGTVLVKVFALAALTRAAHQPARVLDRMPDRALPRYSIMVALYDEAEVLPDLIAALSAIDYPATKLECLLIIEDSDFAMKAALLKLELPVFMRVVVVPDGEPRTKPRALNYALALLSGDYVVIYDAEDRPEPDQLRRALAEFRSSKGGPRLACVQACLNIFNARQSWLSRQFTVEYSALFDAVLPALQRLRLPMPLGGTSNHFPREVLTELCGWDPYNVTEDADLGIRIARLGYRVTVIRSTTWEEAPATFKLWLRQRTRWLKGWMQTYLVHTRQPLALMRDLGFWRSVGFHLYLGGLVLSALVHPLFYAAVAFGYVFDLQSDIFDGVVGLVLWILSVGNLVVGYVSSIFLGYLAARRRGHKLGLAALLMPFYWLLISVAAYRALWQLFSDPFRWEKTPHGLAEED